MGITIRNKVLQRIQPGLLIAGAPLSGTGGNLLINGTVSAVPEPSSYAAVFGALAFGFVFLTRRLRRA